MTEHIFASCFRRAGCLNVLLLALCCLPLSAQAAEYGEVVRVWDGDTVHIRDEHGRRRKIRLADIDAPEIRQAEGRTCRDRLASHLLHQKVRFEVLAQDRYGREVARIWQAGRDANLRQLAEGCAWHDRRRAARRQALAEYARYAAAEQAARAQKTGLWQRPRPQAPWQYRRRQAAGPADDAR